MSFSDDIIPPVIDEHIACKGRLCVIGFHTCAETRGCRFNVPIAVVDSDHDGILRLIFVYIHNDFSFDFDFKKRAIHVDFVGADIFPQGFAAVAGQLGTFRGVNMICDIGNGTMNVMFITDCRPQSGNMFTEKFGTNQCMLNIREQLMRKFGSIPDDAIIESVLRYRTADIAQKYLEVIKAAATEYVAGIFRKLREHEYNPDLMKLYVVGGGGCMIKNFGQYDPKRVIIKEDICATAKGYEYMAKQKLQRGGGKL